MQSSFYLGINQLPDQLLMMTQPGLYWLNVDRQNDAHQLCRQTFNCQTLTAKAAFITVDDDPHSIINESHLTHLTRLPLFSLPLTRQAIQRLSEDLMRSLRPRNTLLVLLTSGTLWQHLSVPELNQWLANLTRWLTEQSNTLLIVNYGLSSHQFRTDLLTQHRSLYGLANLRLLDNNLKYHVDFWCNQQSVLAKQIVDCVNNADGLSMTGQDRTLAQSIKDSDLYLAVKKGLDSEFALLDNWYLFNHNDELAVAGLETNAATLIFAVDKREQIDPLAYQLYHLRQQRGNRLKIVIRVINLSIRQNDEYLLLACGANQIVRETLSVTQWLTTLNGMQGEMFSRHLPDDIETLFKRIHPLPVKGLVNNILFKQAVFDSLHYSVLARDHNGVLLSLTPAPGLNSQQALTLCRIRRDGDFVSLFGNKLMLFLSHCHKDDLASVLPFVFKLPISLIFKERIIWSEDRHILSVIEQLPIESLSLNQQLPLEQSLPLSVAAADTPNEVKITAQVPELITLVTNKNEE